MADRDRAAVRNAADPQQVKNAGRSEKRRAAQFFDNLRAVMGTNYGRAVLWDLIRDAGVFESIYHPSSAIYYNAGRQDYGHKLMAQIITADPALYILMEREARERDARDDASQDAAQTPSADRTGD